MTITPSEFGRMSDDVESLNRKLDEADKIIERLQHENAELLQRAENAEQELRRMRSW